MTNTRTATSTDREVARILSGGVMLLIPRLLTGLLSYALVMPMNTIPAVRACSTCSARVAFREMPVKCHPGIRSARVSRGAALEALHFQWLIATENAGRSLARTGKAINQRFLGLAIAVLLWVLPPGLEAQGAAATNVQPQAAQVGEVIYIPVYSHIVQGDKGSKQPLSSTLVIHNVNPSKSILITSVRYYDHSGTQLKDYIDGPLSLGPFASASFVVDIGEDRGGVGANFIVEWQANETVVSPIAHAIMSGGMGTQGLSFVTEGRVIERRP